MAVAQDMPNARAGVSFALDRIEQRDGQIVVVGCWSGVRGMRFVRPALLVAGKQVLATLEHKPWAPSADRWVAAFPWQDAPIMRADAVLAVAPSVEVWLATGRARVPAPVAPGGRLVAPAVVVTMSAPPPPEPAATAPARVAPTSRSQPAAPSAPDVELRREVRELAEELERARAAAARERELSAAQHDEAVRAREAAVRACARMETERDTATAARHGLSVELDAALARLEEVRAQRDAVVVAHRALQRRLDQRAGAEAPGAAAEPPRVALVVRPEEDEEPLGVRAIPAGRTIAAGEHSADVDARPRATTLDVWAIRILGAITAGCFLGLLVLLLRVFV